jgi:hypothetical protein
VTDARKVSAIEDLLAVVELTGLRTFEVSGRLLEVPASSGVEETQELQVLLRESSDELETRVRLTLQTKEAQFVSDCAAVFRSTEPIKVDPEVKREFVERIGVMSVYPFLRESVFATATRLQVGAPVLGLLRAGQFSLDGPESAEQSSVSNQAEQDEQ